MIGSDGGVILAFATFDWVVLAIYAAVLLGIVLAVVWVSFAVKKVERERNFNPPVPAGAK